MEEQVRRLFFLFFVFVFHSVSFDKNVFKQFFSDEPVRPGGTFRWSLIETAIDSVELGTEFAPDVEPPIAHKDGLAELCTIWTEKRCLTPVYVAVMPSLTPRLHISKETRVGLLVAVKICVWHLS